MAYGINSIAQAFSEPLQQKQAAVIEAIGNVGPDTTPATLLTLQHKLNEFNTVVSLSSSMMKDVSDTTKGIIQKL